MWIKMNNRKKIIILGLLIVTFVLGALLNYFFINLNILRFVEYSSESKIRSVGEYGNRGQNVKIAILDSGVSRDHPEFLDNIKNGRNFVLKRENTDDEFGHGTWITGIIAAQDNNSIGICGIAPETEIYPLVILNKDGRGKIKDVIDGIRWCMDNEVDIINLSFCTPKDDKDLREIIEKAIQKGIIVIASYDNEKKKSYPAQYENVIGVKKDKKTDEIYIMDNICYAPDGVITTDLKGGYVRAKGNSIATAIVSGNVSLLISQCKSDHKIYDVNSIKKMLNKKK